MKKLLAVLLAFAMALALLPAASAASPVWDGRSSEAYAGGTGTEDDPYLIANGAQLYQLALDASDSSANQEGDYISTKGLYYKMTQDLDMGNKAFPGIAYFSGILDGAGYTIKNLKITNAANSCTGLVRRGSSCTIRNVTISGSISGARYTGGIIGYAQHDSIIMQCINRCTVSGTNCVGGICGYAWDSEGNTLTISGCANFSEVLGEGTVGGICGQVEYDRVLIAACSNSAKVSGKYNIGGICGYAGAPNKHRHGATIKACVNAGDVAAEEYNASGIAGSVSCYSPSYYCTIYDCYNTGSITASRHAYGIVNGASDRLNVSKSYNCGSVQALEEFSDTVPSDYSPKNVYYLEGINEGANNPSSAIGLTFDEMTAVGSFAGFDFANIWTWDSSGIYNYPILREVGVVLAPCEDNEHEWNEGTILRAATCTETGELLVTCTKCAMAQNQPIPALGHDVVAGTAVPPTCTEDGLTAGGHCSRCDYTVAQEIDPALGHDMVADTAIPATCTESGLTAGSHCSRCEYTLPGESVPALGHDMVAGTAVPPTCTETGLTAGAKCSRCDHTEPQEIVEALGHNMITDPAVPATCTETGLTEGSHCSRCDHKVAQQTVPALGHDMITLPGYPATCTQNGLTSGAYCSRCDRVIPQTVIPATGHSWDNGVVTTPPTEETEGVKTYTCTVCNATKTEPIPVLGHVHSYSSVVTAPTCTEQGYTTYTCACGDSFKENYVDALGHDATEWIVDLAPTCTVAGSMHTECTRCGALLQTSAIQPSGHTESNWLVDKEATCTEGGAKHKECTVCKLRLQTESIPALGHDYREGICTRCGAEDPNWTEPEDPFVNPFIDVKENDYFYAPVLWAVGEGITNGTTPTTFSPYDPCTRGQIVTFLWRAFGSPEPEKDENPFTDVPENMYYYKAILWAVEQGITTGTSATTFSPEDTCTRGQVATFLWRACGKPAPEGSENPFTDVPETVYYYQPILWAVENGITNGTGNGKFSPEDSCTRGQIVTFLYRALAK